jgi:hypothetical protein
MQPLLASDAAAITIAKAGMIRFLDMSQSSTLHGAIRLPVTIPESSGLFIV